MTAFVLSLTVMSGLEFLYKSRLLSKQRLAKKRPGESLALTTGASSMWSPVCWLVGFEATGFGWRGLLWLLGSQPASQSAGQPAAQTRPGFLILVTCMHCGICWREALHALAFFYGTIRRNASPLTNVVWTQVQFFLFSYCCSPNHDSPAPW